MIGAGLIDRNDRKPLADWVRSRIHSQTHPPDVFIDSSELVPASDDVDIVPRVKFILERAIQEGVNFLYLFENDDTIR